MSNKPTNTHNALQTAISLTAFLLPILYLTQKQKRLTEKQRQYNAEREKERAFLHNLARNPSLQPLRPPLPDIVRGVLRRCRFAYLSTMDVAANSSHLSLMRFTYLPEEELILMSTNIYTKKYEMLEKQNGVALLIHDFSEGNSGSDGENTTVRLTGEYSITLNGTCSVIKDAVLAERYRAAHLKNNPDYPQFIVGKDIAMLRVDVLSARICNINDEVIKWNVEQESTS
ncbi:hypothetical protein HJC23_008040 [Cyclotella cryptica]|uniref:Pyridoxamine 5'-phosphate oxidase N-terminal domain-containing protein n=1 Tax=Cyclotella cryptica TaxID=29204 RepID=A0ABD3Q3R9_9STRA|eukprot:CCRYP_009157-RA/>CCRYP_009157-RA protein AED:0.12 eAED:0.12 QI:372/1/1/1/0.75/0.6/5/284/228